MLTLPTGVSIAGNESKCFNCFKILKIQIVIAVFEFCMKNAVKWVQTSLVLVQWLLR